MLCLVKVPWEDIGKLETDSKPDDLAKELGSELKQYQLEPSCVAKTRKAIGGGKGNLI